MSDRRSDRTSKTIDKTGLRPWQASDSTLGVTRPNFPSFRVDPEDLNGINDYCNREGIARSVLMRHLIKNFLTSIRSLDLTHPEHDRKSDRALDDSPTERPLSR